ncbi:IS66 family insertion sequence element accessory protein TnpA [Lacrimispora aerotolerans]|uniref:IS66 family insertion sequence element accessory protein TnpA n=1 Tax=Lacrimispora aerotolerans TaxID=36832 RepID=UPI0038CD33B1
MERIGECRASTQKVSDWCTAHDVSIKSYYYWLRKIKHEAFDAIPAKRKPKVPNVSFQPSMFAEVPHTNANFSSSTAVIIRLGNTTLEIQNGADQEAIENTLRTIRHLC